MCPSPPKNCYFLALLLRHLYTHECVGRNSSDCILKLTQIWLAGLPATLGRPGRDEGTRDWCKVNNFLPNAGEINQIALPEITGKVVCSAKWSAPPVLLVSRSSRIIKPPRQTISDSTLRQTLLRPRVQHKEKKALFLGPSGWRTRPCTCFIPVGQRNYSFDCSCVGITLNFKKSKCHLRLMPEHKNN